MGIISANSKITAEVKSNTRFTVIKHRDHSLLKTSSVYLFLTVSGVIGERAVKNLFYLAADKGG